MKLLNFQHHEPKSVDQTIKRFDSVVERYQHQGVSTPHDLLQQLILARPIERCVTHKIIRRSKEATNLEEILKGMRDDDGEYLADHDSPRPGSPTSTEAIKFGV